MIYGTVVFRGQMPNLNDVIDQKARSFKVPGKRVDGYSAMKAKWTHDVKIIVQGQIKRRPLPPAYYGFLFLEPTRRRDPDGLCVASKFILDGMMEAGAIPNDGWTEILGLEFRWRLAGDDHQPGIVVAIGDNPQELFTSAESESSRLRVHQQLGFRSGPRTTLDRMIDKESKR